MARVRVPGPRAPCHRSLQSDGARARLAGRSRLLSRRPRGRGRVLAAALSSVEYRPSTGRGRVREIDRRAEAIEWPGIRTRVAVLALGSRHEPGWCVSAGIAGVIGNRVEART